MDGERFHQLMSLTGCGIYHAQAGIEGDAATLSRHQLGDGIVEDQPLPAGETDVRYKKITTYGVTVAVSFGF